MSVCGNIARAHEAIAAAHPDRDCILWRDRRFDYAATTDRTRRFANALLDRGLGGAPRPVRHGWESPHDHVALVLTNGNEYLECMLGAWKARAAAINCNYRYTGAELAEVLADASARAVVYHARFGAAVADAVDRLDHDPLLVVVDDGSGATPIDGSVPFEALLGEASAARPNLDWSDDDRYVVFTGGTTGRPKGVLWRQADFLATALGIARTEPDLVDRAARPDRPRALAAPPFMHGAAHWNAISAWLAGGTVVIQDETDALDPLDVLRTAARHRATSLLIVGDAFARPLLDALRVATDLDLSGLRTVMTGGAILSPTVRDELRAALPEVEIVDILGSSESGRHGVGAAGAQSAEPGVFRPSASTVVLDDAKQRTLSPGDPDIGWLAQRDRVPLGYLGDRARSEATFPTIDGVVHAVAGDRASWRADGSIVLHGRESVTINTGGEKVHAEEVERALKRHPWVYDALVVGRPDPRWGSAIVAVVQPVEGTSPALADVRERAAEVLARYKLPKDLVLVDRVERSPSGKPDYGWAARVAAEGST